MSSIQEVFQVLNELSVRETEAGRAASQSPQSKRLKELVWCLQLAPVAIALLIAAWIHFFQAPPWLKYAGLIALLLGYLGILLTPLAALFLHRKSLAADLRNPIGVLLGNARKTAEIDDQYLPVLMRHPLAMLEEVQLQLKAEREFFERRLGLVVGTIDKIGLVAGLLAAFVSIQNASMQQPFWITSLAYAAPFLYVMALYGHFLLMRLERMVRLMDLAIARSKPLK